MNPKTKIPWWVALALVVVVGLSFAAGYYLNEAMLSESRVQQRWDRADEGREASQKMQFRRRHDAEFDRLIDNCREVTVRYRRLQERCQDE